MRDRWQSVRYLFFAAVLLIPPGHCSSEDATVAVTTKPVVASQSVQAALHEIFADQHCPESALSICDRARLMAPEERYDYLFRQIFPVTAPEAKQVPTVRIVIDFTPTDPAPPVSDFISPQGRRLASGGQLISPALDLVEVAEEVGKLDELLNHLQTMPQNNLLSRKNRAALLGMLQARKGENDLALRELEGVAQLCSQPQPDDEVFRAAELVVCEACRKVPGAEEFLLGVIENVVNRVKQTNSKLPWFRQFRSQQSTFTAPVVTESSDSSAAALQWTSASAMSSFTRGSGIPSSRWLLGAGRATNTSSHGDDYLYFAIPMQGQFQLECDASAFNWMETRPFVAGQWVSPVYNHTSFDLGNIRVEHPRRPIAPPLTRITDSLHMRSSVAQKQLTTTANGRVIHQHQLPANHDPWVALRNGAMQEGWASNVRITGTPEIPRTIEMAATSELESWLPYSDGSVGSHWLPVEGGGIRGQRSSAEIDSLEEVSDEAIGEVASDINQEEAIFYHRPMLEDGTIEYEFFYREGQQNTHPAIDRLCFLMKPDGIRVHWLTDGKFDRTELVPENETVELQNRLLPNTLPLMNEAWNQVQLTLKGDTVELSLNTKPIYRRQLESTNQRRFGFFHFADQEELLVRNVRWTGSWPRSLPDVTQQPLAIPEAEFLDRENTHLTALFQHDFVADGLPEEGMAFIHGAVDKNFTATNQGVVCTIAGTGGYRNATLAPRLSAEGDFDIIAEYDHFESEPPLKGSSSLMLVAFLQNSTNDECFVTRRHMSHTPENQQQILQCAVVSKTGDTVKRDYFATKTLEDRSGRLRLSRRGTKFYYLSAEGNSPNFRLWGTRDCTKDPVQLDGIRLVSQIHEIGQTKVVWKNLSVRAERLSGPALGEKDARLVKLNEERDALPIHKVYDFANEPPSVSALYRWGDNRPWNPDLRGLPILAAGTTNWTSSGITTRQPIVGDFDIQTEFADVQLVTPEKGQGTGVFFQVDLTDVKQTQISAIFNLTDTGSYEFDSQLRTNDESGKPTYRNSGRRNATSASSLRIARRGTSVTIVTRANPEAEERIISQFEVSNAAVSGAKLLVHTGGPVGNSQVTLKTIDVRANFYEPLFIEPESPIESRDRLFVMNSDGTNLRALTAPQPQFNSQGSPDWSPDGSLIAFDTWAGQTANSRIVVIRPDGTGLQDLGEGVLPDFSPDSRRITFSWAGHGVTVMNRDGSDRKVINSDGWGTRWSPNGRWLACGMNTNTDINGSSNVAIVDVASGDVKFLLSGPDATRYTNIFSNLEWSPDSKWLCFKGRRADQIEEFAMVGVPDVSEFSEKPSMRTDQSSRLRLISADALIYDFAWHPSGRTILLSILKPNENRIELHECSTSTGRIRPHVEPPQNTSIKTLAWSPNGKYIVFSSRP